MNSAKNVLISRYILSLFAATALLIGLTLSLSSCEKAPLSGEPVTVRFTIASSTYGAGEEIRASQAVEPETVVTYLGNGLLMETTLEPDVPATRAALVPFDKPTKVYIVAYNSSKQYAGHLTIVAVAATTTVEDNLTLSAGDTYTFVSFACYDAASAAAFDSWVGSRITNNNLKLEDLNPSMDLLYGKETKLITTDTDVTITMKHWFSRITGVTVVNRAGARNNITDIANVSLVTCKADLELFSGAAVKKESAEISHSVTGGWGGINDTIVYSTAALSLLVYPDKGLVLNIGKITIDGDDYAGSATFDRTLVSGTSYTVRATLKNLPTTVPKPVNNSWVGAFWRASETGERIIRIAHTGNWFAVVTEYDGRWDPADGDGVVLSKTPTSDPGVSFTSAKIPATGLAVENYQVLGSSSVNGVAAGEIYLRIGLQKTGTAGPKKSSKWTYSNNPDYNTTFPARYATVAVYYGSTAHLLYLRQGEGDDYVMRNGDYGGGGLNSTIRPHAVRFSPYNLTIPTPLNRQIYEYGKTTGGVIASTFTDYPTQAGALFQFVSLNLIRYAWDASTNAKVHPPATNAQWATVPDDAVAPSPPDDYWTDPIRQLGITNETCPTGYRRPSDGVTHTWELHNPPVLAASEFRYSLWKNPECGYSNFSSTIPLFSASLDYNGGNTDNAVWGYYADGFFDRRQIVNGVGAGAGTASSVSTGNVNIAHVGMLFYNDYPDSKASLFFPAAGERLGGGDSAPFSNAGDLNLTGAQGRYWSCSAKQPNAYLMTIPNIPKPTIAPAIPIPNAYMEVFSPNNRALGLSIRCVRSEPEPELINSIISDPWSGGDTDTKDQWVNW